MWFWAFYKAALTGAEVMVADRWFASSKLCSACGNKTKTLPLSCRNWVCDDCGVLHQRDVNAAINLRNWAVSSTVTACGASSGGAVASVIASHGALKQESNAKANYS